MSALFYVSEPRVLCAMCRKNEAYCLAEVVKGHTSFVCGTCPIAAKIDSIKLDDVTKLLAWSREVLAGGTMGGSTFEALRSIIGQKP